MYLVSKESWSLSDNSCGMYDPLTFPSMTGEPVDRRSKPRLALPLPVSVRGRDARGKPFVIDTLLENISADGAYIRMPSCPALGTAVRVLVRFSTSSDISKGARVAAHGAVVRIEEHKLGYGVAVRFTNHKFL